MTTSKLTKQEEDLIDMLAIVWNKYCELPAQKNNRGYDATNSWESTEFMMHIHALQNSIAARPTYRSLWRKAT